MNVETSNVVAPPAPKRLEEMMIPIVMMRDILLKTIFRKNLDQVSDIARAVCLPIPVTQELVDLARTQKLIEATGTLHANSGGEMGYQLTDSGRARALDALSQSEYMAQCLSRWKSTANRSNANRSETFRSHATS